MEQTEEKQEVKDIERPKNQPIRIFWTGPEFIYYPKETSWYIEIAIAALAMIGIFVWVGQYYSASLVFLVAVYMFTMGKNKPQNIQYVLDPSGISFKGKTHKLDQFKSFWIVEGDFISTLYLEKTNKLSPAMTVHIARVDFKPIREFLLKYLPEKVGSSDVLEEKFSRFLRF